MLHGRHVAPRATEAIAGEMQNDKHQDQNGSNDA
jgi:hypothetical protein